MPSASARNPSNRRSINWTNRSTRVLSQKYGRSGRGKKENFKRRKDTIFRKSHALARELDVNVLCMMYQPHTNQWHLYRDPGSDRTWPFDMDAFLEKTEKAPVVSMFDDDDSSPDPRDPEQEGRDSESESVAASSNGTSPQESLIGELHGSEVENHTRHSGFGRTLLLNILKLANFTDIRSELSPVQETKYDLKPPSRQPIFSDRARLEHVDLE